MFQKLNKLVKNSSIDNDTQSSNEILELPKEFKSLLDNQDIIARHALAYLKKRNITKQDILKYNIGYCDSGR
jgi:DNA primase